MKKKRNSLFTTISTLIGCEPINYLIYLDLSSSSTPKLATPPAAAADRFSLAAIVSSAAPISSFPLRKPGIEGIDGMEGMAGIDGMEGIEGIAGIEGMEALPSQPFALPNHPLFK
ncbi:hypothetical protein GQX74_000707 [Glossina fuscipes]|nr:hypothetical protein GQX74_000707 [Glossina fuscipes]